MKLLDLFKKHKQKTVLIVQCRLSPTRLPRKALLPLGGKTVLEWVLASMKQVKADQYYLAVDTDSAEELKPIAEKCGWNFFAGSREDVLDRFCHVIELSKADVVVRATADNPFLFYEAANALEDEYFSREETSPVDYITWTDLPHGSGIEMFNAHSLLKAKTMTDSPYDHEHVGPALYNQQEDFTSVMMPCPEQWNHPLFRTTIATPADYRRALAIVRFISGGKALEEPYTSDKIVSAFSEDSVVRPVLCVPCVKKGRGTGHLRRCLAIALEIGGDVYVPGSADLEEVPELISQAKMNGLSDWQIIKTLPQKGDYALIITDSFVIDRD